MLRILLFFQKFNVFFMTHSTSEVGEELKKKVQATRVTATKNADTVIENYKNEGWKKYLQKDIQNLVRLAPRYQQECIP